MNKEDIDLDEICSKVAREEFPETGGLNDGALYDDYAKAVAKRYAKKLEVKRLGLEVLLNDVLSVEVEEPEWDEGGRIHNWRNYVPEEIQSHWKKLSLETKLVVFRMAHIQAQNEEWE